MRMLCNVILARQKRAHAAKLQDALAAVQHFKLIHGQQAFTELLVIQAVRRFASPRFACVVGVDGLAPKRFGQGFERRRLFAAEKQARVTVADDGFRIVLVQCLELALRLQNQTRGDFSAANRRHQLFQFWNLPDIGALVDQTTHMHGQSPAVHVVSLVAQEIEKLGITHSNQEIKAVVRIAHNEEQRRLLVAQRIEFQFVIRRQLTQFGDVEHRQPRAAGNQNAFRRFSRDEKSRTFSSNS